MGFVQIYQGVKDCGTAPFCRLVVWVNQQIDLYAALMGRQIRGVTMGPQVGTGGIDTISWEVVSDLVYIAGGSWRRRSFSSALSRAMY